MDNQLTSLPTLPSNLQRLNIPNLQELNIPNLQELNIPNLPLISSNESSILSDKCNNKENLLQDDLDTSHNVIVIILPTNDKYIAYCYQIDEIKNIFDIPDPIYEWIKDSNRPNLNKRVYKEPYSGIYFDNTSRKLINVFNTFIITPIEEKRLGTGEVNWVSRMHGTDQDIRMIYKLNPILRNKFLTKEKITEEDYLINNINPTIYNLL